MMKNESIRLMRLWFATGAPPSKHIGEFEDDNGWRTANCQDTWLFCQRNHFSSRRNKQLVAFRPTSGDLFKLLVGPECGEEVEKDEDSTANSCERSWSFDTKHQEHLSSSESNPEAGAFICKKHLHLKLDSQCRIGFVIELPPVRLNRRKTSLHAMSVTFFWPSTKSASKLTLDPNKPSQSLPKTI